VEKKLDRRLLYRAIVKLMIAIGLSFVIYAFVAEYVDMSDTGRVDETIRVDVRGLVPNSDMRVRWNGAGLIIVHRSPHTIRQLRENPGKLSDPYSRRSKQPEFAGHQLRSLEDEYLVAWLPEPATGCTTLLVPAGLTQPGQIVNSCSGQAWDFSGRAFADTGEAPNLEIPEHRWMTPTEIVIFR
jgi:hypothetical protein